MVLFSVGIGLGAGTSSVLARAIGEGDRERVRRLTTDGLILAFITVVILSILGVATIDPLFSALGAGPGLLPLVRDYMLIWYVGIVFLVVPMVGMAAIRATGDSRLPSLVMIAAAVANTVLDPLLIFGLFGLPRLELQGAAIASVIARAVTLVVALWVLHFRLRMLTLGWPGPAAIGRSWRSILHVGLPAAATNVIIPLATGVVVALIATYGPEAVAGFGVASRIEAMTLIVFYAMSAIIGPFVGQNLGAGKRQRIEAAMRLSVLFCFGFGAVIALALWLLAEPLAGAFIDAPGVVAVAAAYLVIVPVGYGGYGVVMIANAAFNGLGMPGRAVAVSVMRVAVIYVPAAYLGSRLLGLNGIFAAAAAANLVAGIGAYLLNRQACRQQPTTAAPDHLPETEAV
jgi:putative MATE family efflux protein